MIIWIMPVIGLGIYALLMYLKDRPHTFNYPTPVTTENAERIYKIGVSLMRYILLIIISIFVIIEVAIIYGALNPGKNILGPWLLIGTLVLTVFIPIIMAYKMSDTMKKTEG